MRESANGLLIDVAAAASSPAKAEDAASADGDIGFAVLAVRKATPGDTSGTDGDYEFLQIKSGRLWGSVVVDTALPAGANVIGGVTQSGTWTVQPGNTANTTAWKVDGSAVTQPVSLASGATAIAKAEDVASADADVGVPSMAVRKATPANTSGTDGDYEMLQMSAGRLWVDASGKTLDTKELRPATPSQSSVASSATNVTVLASNANRLGATITNDSTQVLYLKLGATASTSSYTVTLAGAAAAPFAYYEVPFGYTGIIDGIWASANGNARITELTA